MIATCRNRRGARNSWEGLGWPAAGPAEAAVGALEVDVNLLLNLRPRSKTGRLRPAGRPLRMARFCSVGSTAMIKLFLIES